MRNRFKIRVQQEVGTGEWIMVRYHASGWSVLFRGEYSDAHDYAQSYVNGY